MPEIEAPQYAQDIANIIKQATPTITKIIKRKRTGGQLPAATRSAAAPAAAPADGKILGLKPQTLLLAAAAVAALYFLTRKKR